MKYKVIGWTYDDDFSVPSKEVSNAKRNVVIDEIRKNGYDFSGEEFQECMFCVPVFNDGTKYSASRRGWGAVMAEAHGLTDPFDYAVYTDRVSESSVRPTKLYREKDFERKSDLKESFFIKTDNEELFLRFTKGDPIAFFPERDQQIIDALRYLDKGDTLNLTCQGRSFHRLVQSVVFEKQVTEQDRFDFYKNYVCNLDDPPRRDAALEKWNNIPFAYTISFRTRKK